MMHMKSTPRDMQNHTQYSNITNDVINYFSSKINYLKQNGVKT